MRAISIRQPWAHLILYGGKDVENRTWKTNFRGKILIHAAKMYEASDRKEIQEKQMLLGGIVGIMEIVDCVTAMDSDWFCGPYGFVIKNARPLPFFACAGRLHFFEVEYPYQTLTQGFS